MEATIFALSYVFSCLIVIGLLGLIGYQLAAARGRDAVLGILVVLLFGIWGIIYYLIVGDTEELKAQKLNKK